jgi:serine protease Do
VRTATKEVAQELYSIIASLSAAAGNPLDLRGNLGGSSYTPTKEALKNAGLKKQAGVAVNLVEIGGPSEKAGLKVGDVILSINGNAIESYEHFEKKVWPSLDLSAEWFDLEIMRKGKKETVKIRTLPADQLPVPPKSLSFGKVPGAGSDGKEPPKLGLVLRNLTMSEKSALKGRTGAAVLEIKPGGLAEAMKMQPGDIILFCNGKVVPSAEGLSGLLVEGENNFLLLRNGKELTVGVNTVTASY